MKINRKAILAVVWVIVISAVICCAAESKVDLKLRLKAGEKHEMKTTQTQHITQTFSGQEQKMKQTMETVIGYDCLSVDSAGNMDVEMTYKSMKMAVDGPMGHIEFDSAGPAVADANNLEQKMMAEVFSAITGSKCRMKISPTGKVLEIDGLREMIAGIKAKVNSPASEGLNFLDKMFDEKEIKETTGNMMGAFPQEPVAVGDSWYDTTSINFVIPIDVDTTYMLKNRKDGIATIDAVAKIDMGDSSKAMEIDPASKMSVQLSGTVNVTSQVDEKTGLTRKADGTMNFSGIIKMEANPQMPEGMVIPMTILGNVTVELIK